MTDIRNPVPQHRDPVYPESECESRVLLRIPARLLEHVGIHAAAAAYFDPAGLLAGAAPLALAEIAGHVHLGGGPGEGEIAGTETQLGVGAEHVLDPQVQSALQVGE